MSDPDSENKLEVVFKPNVPKYLNVANAVIKAIHEGKMKKGYKLPSINEMSAEYELSRDTVEKAYKELRQQKILESVKGKGYFVKRVDVLAPLRILLLFNKMSNYKKQIYESFIETLGLNATVNLHIHHSDLSILERIIDNNMGMYDYYVIMPHFYKDQERFLHFLEHIPKEKLIFLDKDLPDYKRKFAAIYQDFERDVFETLKSAEKELRRYERLIYVNPSLSLYPEEIKKGFISFCKMEQFDYSVIEGIDINEEKIEGAAFLVIAETDLADLIKNAKKYNLEIGKDVGIISYNETPLKEVLLNGITVISTDHVAMGKKAAEVILSKKSVRVKNPFKIIKRKSL